MGWARPVYLTPLRLATPCTSEQIIWLLAFAYRALTEFINLYIFSTCQSSRLGAVDSILSYLESNCPFFILSFCVSVYYIFQHDFTEPLVYLELLALARFLAPSDAVLATKCVEVIALL
jgi:hypothetical protein